MYLVLQKKDEGNKEDIVEMEPGEYLAAVCRRGDGDIRDTYREIKDLMKKNQNNSIPTSTA